ncbi:unnamed protein product [Schistocephalus solidus]|uniref:C2H2-type domain-containing protein n=1 Tax=Schistocephalus solidus TaxID=70667 RepID=A0A183SUE7_SCHSO|nr:unnamed protein product [Schistocephalus solidus]
MQPFATKSAYNASQTKLSIGKNTSASGDTVLNSAQPEGKQQADSLLANWLCPICQIGFQEKQEYIAHLSSQAHVVNSPVAASNWYPILACSSLKLSSSKRPTPRATATTSGINQVRVSGVVCASTPGHVDAPSVAALASAGLCSRLEAIRDANGWTDQRLVISQMRLRMQPRRRPQGANVKHACISSCACMPDNNRRPRVAAWAGLR